MHTKGKMQLTVRWMCFALLIFAAVVRLAAEPAVQTGLLQTAQRVFAQPRTVTKANDLRKTYPLLLYTPPVRHEKVEFEAQDAQLVDIRNGAEAEFDAAELITRPLRFDADVEGPLVLIVHTHGTEAYTPTQDTQYTAAGSYHTQDTQYNVVRVGQALADTLTAQGIETMNDETLCDLESYNDSYLRSAEVIEAYLEKYPSIQMVIDLHRDAIEDDAGNQMAMTTELEGENAARLLLVMGTNVSGMYHPNWEDNLSCALKIQALCEKQFPGWFRQMSVRSQRYNEHLTPCSILLEVGTAGNTLDEALRSAEYFGSVLAQLLLSAQ